MRHHYRLRLGPIAAPLRHCVAAIAMFAQCLMVIAPIADLRDAAPLPRTLASVVELGVSHVAVDTDHGHQHAHDPSTCPACIAQSIIAHVNPPTRAFAVVVDERTRLDLLTAVPHQTRYPTRQQSRAPPSAS